MNKIGILGSGMVGQALGNGFIKFGYQVMIGTRDTSKLTEWLSSNEKLGKLGSFSDAAEFGEILILAGKASAAKDMLSMAGKSNLKGKIIIDTTNPIADSPPENGVLRYFSSLNYSLMEELQNAFQEAHFVKSFSVIGSHLMVKPDFNGIKPSMFICGNNQAAKATVSAILDEFGFETEDMGEVEAARAIEPLAMLWCIPGLRENKWSHALKLIKQ